MRTSYYWKNGSHPDAVAISQGVPKWYTGNQYKKLAPTWAMIKLPEKLYVIEYGLILARLDPRQVYNELGEDAILLCYEKPGEFCHRRLVAKWFENELGIMVPEIAMEEPAKNTPAKTLKLERPPIPEIKTISLF